MTVMELKGYLKNVCALERKLYETKLCKEKEERDYKLKLDGLNQKLKKDKKEQEVSVNSLNEKKKELKNVKFKKVEDNTLPCVVTVAILIGILGMATIFVANALGIVYPALFALICTVVSGAFAHFVFANWIDEYESGQCSAISSIVFSAVALLVTMAICIFLKIIHIKNSFAVGTFIGIIIFSIVCWILLYFHLSYKSEIMLMEVTTIVLFIIGCVVEYVIYFIVNLFIDINFIVKNTILLVIIEIIACYFTIYFEEKRIFSLNSSNEYSKKRLNKLVIEIRELTLTVSNQDNLISKDNLDISNLINNHNDEMDILNRSIRYYSAEIQNQYSKNILHLNYQNWVAAATIYELLDTGRTYTLTGPFGAYNLYENEAKFKTIKELLKNLISINRESVSNQIYITNEIRQCHRSINDINYTLIKNL